MSNKGHKWLAAGTATFIAEPVFAFAHQGAVGVILGVAAGAAAYALIDDVEQVTGKQLSLPARHRSSHPQARTREKASLGYRLLVGKSAREEAEADDDLDTVLVAEEEAEALPDTVELGDLHPHVDTVLSNRVAILGMSGAGKSNLVADFVEELGQYDAPLIVLDHKGEYGPLCATPYLLRPVRANARNLTPANARAFAQQIMQERLQVVVDLSSYRDADAALVMAGLIAGVAAYQKPLDKADRVTCTIVLEEAHYWLPQDQSQSTIRGIKNRGDENGQTLLAYLQQTFFNLSKIGRYLGMGLIVATQRPADVDNRLISSSEWYFLLKAMLPADLARYKGFGAPDGVAQKLNPKKGEAYVIGPDGTPGVYHLRRRFSPDESQTPGLANIRNAAPVGRSSHHSHSPGAGVGERGNVFENSENVKTRIEENGPEKPFPQGVNGRRYSHLVGEYSQRPENDENGPDYTPAEESRVLLGYADLRGEYGGKPVPRTAIRDRLEWDNRKYQRIIKPVCDKHGIA